MTGVCELRRWGGEGGEGVEGRGGIPCNSFATAEQHLAVGVFDFFDASLRLRGGGGVGVGVGGENRQRVVVLFCLISTLSFLFCSAQGGGEGGGFEVLPSPFSSPLLLCLPCLPFFSASFFPRLEIGGGGGGGGLPGTACLLDLYTLPAVVVVVVERLWQIAGA